VALDHPPNEFLKRLKKGGREVLDSEHREVVTMADLTTSPS
jgi:hypothetical protein